MTPNIIICEKCQHFDIIGPDVMDCSGKILHFTGATLLCTLSYSPVHLGDYLQEGLQSPLNPDYFKPNKSEDVPYSCPYALEHALFGN